MPLQYSQFVIALCAVIKNTIQAGRLDSAARLLALNSDYLLQEDLLPEDRAGLLLADAQLKVREMMLQGRSFDSTWAAAERAYEAIQETGDPVLKAQIEVVRGQVHHHFQLGQDEQDFSTARQHYEHALVLWQALDDPAGLSNALFRVGLIHQFTNAHDEARDYFQRAYDLAREHSLKIEQSYAVRHLGFLQFTQGDLAAARASLEESLRLREEADYRAFLPFSHIAVGDVAAQQGEPENALHHYTRAQELAAQHADQRAMMLADYSLGEFYQQQGDVAQARAYCEEARTRAEALGHKRAVTRLNALLEELSD